ncbi:MAG: GNAT family N-acetyltransferase [Actinomycetota bacterium]|nr:GNAT family N-acetyltransferase [Actinomycetota bacterium]
MGETHTWTNEHGQPVGEPLPGWTRRRRPDPDRLTGDHCRVERLTLRHGDSLFSAVSADVTGRSWTYLSTGPFESLDAFRAAISEMIGNADQVSMAITDPGGRAIGLASYLRIEPEIGSVEVGAILFSPALQGTTAATEAMYLMASYVFDDLGYRRYEWKCDVLNAASTAAARRLGFSYEGTWRNATTYKGRNRDTAWFAMTDGDWALLRPAYRQWLAPANFDQDGQRASLSQLTRRALRPNVRRGVQMMGPGLHSLDEAVGGGKP